MKYRKDALSFPHEIFQKVDCHELNVNAKVHEYMACLTSICQKHWHWESFRWKL